jgi:anaerobic selenocysteine-containing dehydrogenase
MALDSMALDSMAAQQLQTACPLDCPDTCSLTVTVDAGRLVAVDAGPGNDLTDGFICQKVKHHPRRVYAPERVLTPLVRTGLKGEGQFRGATWDEALTLVAERLRSAIAAGGPESVVPYLYNSSTGAAQGVLTERLFRRLGASRVDHTICALTNGIAYHTTFGDMLSADPRDVVHSRHVIVWGANPTVANVHFPPLVTRAVRDGARLTVVDPRATAMAKRAHRHVALRPGTDVVLALAIAAELERAGGLDTAFLADHATGVDEYLTAAREWTPERAAHECGIAADDVRAFAADLATIRPAFLRVGWGLERNRNGGSSCAAVYALAVLGGHFGELGSGVMSSLSSVTPYDADTRDPDTPPELRRARHVNMNTFGRLLTEPGDETPVRFLYVEGNNLAATNPDQTRVHAGLRRDDLFTVVHDQVLTDTARFADVVLPATTHFEARDVAGSYGTYTLQELPAVIERVGESRTNNEVAADLAARLGLRADRYDAGRVIEGGITDGGGATGARELRAPGTTVQFRDVFPPGGRAQLAALPGITVPRYEPLHDDYPLTLLTPASPKTINSMFGEFQRADTALRIHPADAAARGLADGARVVVRNDRAAITTTLRVDPDLRTGVVTMPKGLWCRDLPEGLTPNALVPDALSDLGGGACFNDTRVEVSLA